MDDRNNDMQELDQLFAATRHLPLDLPEGLNQRILADAEQVQALHSVTRIAAAPQGIWSQFLGVLGGWPTLGGLATTCAAGIWIGLAPPSFLPDPAWLVIGDGMYLDVINADNLAVAMSEEG